MPGVAARRVASGAQRAAGSNLPLPWNLVGRGSWRDPAPDFERRRRLAAQLPRASAVPLGSGGPHCQARARIFFSSLSFLIQLVIYSHLSALRSELEEATLRAAGATTWAQPGFAAPPESPGARNTGEHTVLWINKNHLDLPPLPAPSRHGRRADPAAEQLPPESEYIRLRRNGPARLCVLPLPLRRPRNLPRQPRRRSANENLQGAASRCSSVSRASVKGTASSSMGREVSFPLKIDWTRI